MHRAARIILPLFMALLVAVCPPAFAGSPDYDKGVAFLRAGDAGEALALLEPLKASDPSNPYLFYHLGLAYYNLGRLDESYGSFMEAARLSGSNGAADELGIDAAFFSLGAEMYRSGSYGQARKSLEKGLAYNPTDGEGLYYLGLTLAELGEYEKARERLDAAAVVFETDTPSLAAVRNAYGILYHKMGDNRAAMDEFRRTLELDPVNVEALYYLGRITYAEEGYAAARPHFDRIVNLGAAADEKTRDTLFTTFFNMGVDFQDRGKASNAAEMFTRALSLKPEDAEARYYLGYNYMALERYEDAYSEFRQALSIDPALERARAQMEVAGRFAAETRLRRADELMARGEYHAALPLYEKAASLDPGNSGVRSSLAKARDSVDKDISARAANIRGLISNGAYLEAKTAADELNSLAPGARESLKVLEDVSAAMSRARRDFSARATDAEASRNLSLAADYYSAILDIDPDDQAARAGLGRARGRIAEARRSAESAFSDGLYREALDAYRLLLDYVPGDPDATVGVEESGRKLSQELALALKDANESFGEDDYTMAAHHASRALQLDPGNAEALGLRRKISDRSREMVLKFVREGDGYIEEGLLEKARDSYEAALLLDPENVSATKGLERANYTPVSSEVEDEVRKVYLKGVEHYTSGDLEKAIEAWREVLRLDPSNEKALSSIRRAEEKIRQTSN